MIIDEQSIFSDNQAITADAASQNILNFGKREVAFGTPIEIFIQFTENFNNVTSLGIAVQTANDEAFTTPVNLVEQTILLAKLKKGNVSTIKFIPKGNLGYMRLYYTVTGTAPTIGKIFAVIADGSEESFHNM